MLVVIEVVPYRCFKEKIRIVKSFEGKGKIEIFKGYVYIEQLIRGNDFELYSRSREVIKEL